MNVCNPSPWKQRQKDPKFKVIFGLHSNFKAALHYLRPYLKEKKKKNHIVLFAQIRI